MDARRLRFGAMLAATLGVVGLALALGMSGGGEGAGAQTTGTPATTLPANPPRCTATTLGGSRTANAALAADCDALLAMKTVLWRTQPGYGEWSSTRPLASWHGVTVEGAPKRVTKLKIWGKELGVLPTQLGGLTGLTEVILYDNGLTGVIPTQLGDLTALRKLVLGGNGLTGSMPTQLGNLRALTELEVQGNSLSGVIPTQLGGLTALTKLALDRNRLSGAIPTQLGSLSALRELWLFGNRLSGVIPTQLGSLTALTKLVLDGNQLSGVIPTQLGSATGLTILALQRNRLTGSIPSELGSLTALTKLDLSGNRLTGSIPSELGSLTALTELRLSGNRLTGSIPTQLGSLTKLRTLALSGNTLTGCVPPPLWLVTTNDLVGSAYCPVPRGGVVLVAGKYQFPNSTLIISIPSTTHKIVWSETIVSSAGLHFCLKDQTEKTSICLDSADGSVDLREVFPGSTLASGPSGASMNRFTAPEKSNAPFAVLDSVVSSTLP